MGRAKADRADKEQFEPLVKSLVKHGLPDDFAKQIVNTAIEKGWSEARVLLHAGGWEPVELFIMGEKRVSLRRMLWTKRK